jgi:hypothetical protein
MKVLLVSAFALLLTMPPGEKNFAGVWKLDAKKSVNLPSSFASVESYTMEIRQTKDSMIVLARLVGNGQNVTFPLTNYLLNGKEVLRVDSLRLTKRWITCTWGTGGSTFLVNSRVEQGDPQRKKEYTQRDEWKFLDSTTLQISVEQKFIQGDSTRSERRIFHKVP